MTAVKMRPEVRVYDVNPQAAGHELWLPPCRIGAGRVFPGRAGGLRFTVFCHASSAHAFTVRRGDGSAVQQGTATCAPGQSLDLYLLEADSQHGTWLGVLDASYARGAGLSTNRLPFSVVLGQSSHVPFVLRDHLLTLGWDGLAAVAVTLEVPAGITRGSNGTLPAIETGASWPAGSTLLVINRGTIAGRGGAGGWGGNVGAFGDPETPGAVGGTALQIELQTSIANHGTIQGGGGGGGGGNDSASFGGGGGGGGAGSQGGPGGAGGVPGGQPGFPGGLSTGGGGGTAGGAGAGAGGTGGTPGQAGTVGGASGAAGGAAGAALRVRTAFHPVTFIVPGTVLGPTVTF